MFDNVIITESPCLKISLLNSHGQLTRTMMAEADGIKYPWSLSIDRLGHLSIVDWTSIQCENNETSRLNKGTRFFYTNMPDI